MEIYTCCKEVSNSWTFSTLWAAMNVLISFRMKFLDEIHHNKPQFMYFQKKLRLKRIYVWSQRILVGWKKKGEFCSTRKMKWGKVYFFISKIYRVTQEKLSFRRGRGLTSPVGAFFLWDTWFAYLISLIKHIYIRLICQFLFLNS